MNVDFHWQVPEGDVLHSSEHVASSGPAPSGPCPFCSGVLNAGCRRGAESPSSPPALLGFGPAKDIDIYRWYIWMWCQYPPVWHICKQDISCFSSPLMVFSLVFFLPLPYMFISDASVYAINSETPFTCSWCRFAKDSTQPLDWRQSIPILGLSSL